MKSAHRGHEMVCFDSVEFTGDSAATSQFLAIYLAAASFAVAPFFISASCLQKTEGLNFKLLTP